MSKEHAERGRLAESLSYWYLRLNGFFTIENFLLHPDRHDRMLGKRTDADIVGIRFPARSEQGMSDDERLLRISTKPLLVICEAVAGKRCKINGPWSRPERRNMQRLLTALGLPEPHDVESVAAGLYGNCFAETTGYCFQYVCFGIEDNPGLQESHPGLLQITWSEVLTFIHRRFHEKIKSDHQGWRQDGVSLWAAAQRTEEHFVNMLLDCLVADITETSGTEIFVNSHAETRES